MRDTALLPSAMKGGPASHMKKVTFARYATTVPYPDTEGTARGSSMPHRLKSEPKRSPRRPPRSLRSHGASTSRAPADSSDCTRSKRCRPPSTAQGSPSHMFKTHIWQPRPSKPWDGTLLSPVLRIEGSTHGPSDAFGGRAYDNEFSFESRAQTDLHQDARWPKDYTWTDAPPRLPTVLAWAPPTDFPHRSGRRYSQAMVYPQERDARQMNLPLRYRVVACQNDMGLQGNNRGPGTGRQSQSERCG
ncbi:hypothetical protein ANO11243_067910 [Dothideomycetidae sp. 11243]|nr:hypothetical protein ANO11243_067910 [fungal sp. No.11243]